MKGKLFGILGLGLVACSAHAAISFSNISTPSGVTATVVGDSIRFYAGNFFFTNTTRSYTVTYTVTSGLGILTTAQFSNSGTIKKASFTANITHDNTKTGSWSAGATPSSLTPAKYVGFANTATYNVTMAVTATAQAGGYVNAKTSNVAYNEAVPEPASMAALALGFGLIAKRRIRK